MPDPVAGRRRFYRAALLGSLVALVVDVVMLAGGHPSLVRDTGPLGAFYDVQGRALLHGHLDVDPGAVGFEGFDIDGRTYLYFGPVPALLRLPVLAVTHGLDGRLTQLSMLLALAVLLGFGARLHWRLRALVSEDAPVDRPDAIAAFLVQVALGAGGVALFLASTPQVYYEAELWGAAFSVAAVDALVGILRRPSGRRIAWAGLLAALAVNTRFSVGLGPILALAVVGVGAAAQLRPVRALAWLGPPRGQVTGRTVAYLAAAALAALATSAAVNQAKFHRPFGFPIDKQLDSRIDPNRRALLKANGNSLFGVKYVPSTLLQTVRPDAVGAVRAFPFVGLPHAPPANVGGLRFDLREQSLSAFTSMPLLCLLALVGLVAVVRRVPLRPLTGVLAGTLAGYAPALAIADITTRYLADLLPFLLLAGLVGLRVLLAGPPRRRGWILAGVATLTLVGLATNGGAGLVFQRLLNPTTSEADRAAFVRTQNDVDRALGRRARGVHGGARLPARARGALGDLFVVGPCAGLYVATLHGSWLPVERTDRSGLYRVRIRLPRPLGPAPRTLLTVGAGREQLVLTLRGTARRMLVSLSIGGRLAARSPPLAIPRRPATVVLSIDPFAGRYYATVRVGGRTALSTPAPYDPNAAVTVGGGAQPLPSRAPVCREVARRAGLPLS